MPARKQAVPPFYVSRGSAGSAGLGNQSHKCPRFRLTKIPRHIASHSAGSLHQSSLRPRPLPALPIVIAAIGHPVTHGNVREAGAQTGLRQVFGPHVARYQRVRPGGVPSVEDA